MKLNLWLWINEKTLSKETWDIPRRITQSTQELRREDSSVPAFQLPVHRKTECKEGRLDQEHQTSQERLTTLSRPIYGIDNLTCSQY